MSRYGDWMPEVGKSYWVRSLGSGKDKWVKVVECKMRSKWELCRGCVKTKEHGKLQVDEWNWIPSRKPELLAADEWEPVVGRQYRLVGKSSRCCLSSGMYKVSKVDGVRKKFKVEGLCVWYNWGVYQWTEPTVNGEVDGRVCCVRGDVIEFIDGWKKRENEDKKLCDVYIAQNDTFMYYVTVPNYVMPGSKDEWDNIFCYKLRRANMTLRSNYFRKAAKQRQECTKVFKK